MGFAVSAREALLRQVRGLQATDWQEDAAAFQAYGSAVLQLAQTTLDAAQNATGHTSSASSVRLQLKSTLKQAAEMHSSDQIYHELQKVLGQIETYEAAGRRQQ